MQAQLNQAYTLIQEEKVEEAIAILRPIVDDYPENVDAWWLLANAVTDPEDARYALENILARDPNHEQARGLLEQLNTLYPAVPAASQDMPDFAQPDPVPPTMPGEIRTLERLEDEESTPALDFSGLFDEDDEGLPPFEPFEDEDEEQAEARPRRRPLLRSVLILLLVVVIAAGIIAVLLNSQPAPTATAPTTVPTAVVLEPSDTVQTVLEAAESAANAQESLLGGPASVRLEQRDAGPTLIVRVCRPVGTDITTAMDTAMEIAARYSISIDEEITAVGADLVDCEREDVLYSGTVTIETAAAFANGEITPETFRSRWQ